MNILTIRKLCFTLVILCGGIAYSQLGFCTGDKGLPIFEENFGTGTDFGPELSASVTTYKFISGLPFDGQYTISSKVGQFTSWHQTADHTPDDIDGKAFIVNADVTSGQFYKRKVASLCENTTYEFSAWLLNVYDRKSTVCKDGGIPVAVRFEIWNGDDTQLLASGDTGEIPATNSPEWNAYGLIFDTAPGQTEVILKMINNGMGGCGNDLAIDDIAFRACGSPTSITSDITANDGISICEDQAPSTTQLTATTEGNMVYQWQQSEDNLLWQNIESQTQAVFTIPLQQTTTYYRVNIAQNANSLGSDFCSFYSKPFLVEVYASPTAPISLGNKITCPDNATPYLEVSSTEGSTTSWFTLPEGGQPITEGTSFLPAAPGTYYAESKNAQGCTSAIRTPVSWTKNTALVFESEYETYTICPEQLPFRLEAGIENAFYIWNNGVTERSQLITTNGTYEVKVTNAGGCTGTQTFEVILNENPVLADKNFSQGPHIVIETENSGMFEYSLDGLNYTSNSQFLNQAAGMYTVYARNVAGCQDVTRKIYHLNIPKFITPNNDGINDFFELPDLQYFKSKQIRIFDRYGRLQISSNGNNFRWQPTAGNSRKNNQDYWYEIIIEDKTYIGHFSVIL